MIRKIGPLLIMICFGLGVGDAQQPAQPAPESPPNPAAAPAPMAPPAMQSLPNLPQTPTAAPSAQGQQPQPPQPTRPPAPSARPVPNSPSVPNIPNPPMDPLADVMFPPDLILGHSRELSLTAEQKGFMRGEIQKTTSRFTELQWSLHDAMDELHQTLEGTSVNDQQALALLDKVLDIEREIKRLHIGMGIRLKNKLTPEQQAKLQNIRKF